MRLGKDFAYGSLLNPLVCLQRPRCTQVLTVERRLKATAVSTQHENQQVLKQELTLLMTPHLDSN